MKHAIPVLVGAASITQKADNPAQAREAWALMRDAAIAAARDAGAPTLLHRLESVRVPKGMWSYSDPGRLVAEAVGSPAARTTLADIGILQTSLLAEACEAIQAGREQVALVLGGEARYRQLLADKSGQPVHETAQTTPPDIEQKPEAELWSAVEWEHGLGMPVTYYALMENALRFAEGQPLEAHREAIASLWAAFSQVAAGNPDAWFRDPMPAEAIATPSTSNRLLAYPYAKWHTSQWNVDQAAALLLCSEAVADELGVPESRRVYPLAITESNAMFPVVARRELHRCPGYALAAARALEFAGLGIDDIDLFELYSCFPVAVRVQAREMGVPTHKPWTQTGGMAFAGGPLNNFVYQSLVTLVQALRSGRGRHGLLTAVSGLLTKQGVSIWSMTRPAHGYGYADVSGEVREATALCNVVDAATGTARIASYTVTADKAGSPVRAIAVLDLPDGSRTVAHSDEAGLLQAMTRSEFCGQTVRLLEGNVFECPDLP